MQTKSSKEIPTSCVQSENQHFNLHNLPANKNYQRNAHANKKQQEKFTSCVQSENQQKDMRKSHGNKK